jgi:hypothetical protein
MSNKNKNAAAEAVAALQSTYDLALEALNALGKTVVTAEEKVEAQKAYDSALEALQVLPETAAVEEKAEAQAAVDLGKEILDGMVTAEELAAAETAVSVAKEALDKVKGTKGTGTQGQDKQSKAETLIVKFVLSPTGKFNLAYNVGEKASLPKLQAEELIDAGYAKLAK